MKTQNINKLYHAEKNLFFLYRKKSFANGKFVLSLIPIIWIVMLSTGIVYNQLDMLVEITQRIVDGDFFWQGFIFQFRQFGPSVPIIITASIISYDFAKNTAPLIYASISRKRYLASNIIFLILHQILLVTIAFLVMDVIMFVLVQKFISFHVLLIGFSYALLLMIFYTSFTFIISTLILNSNIALLIPLLYWFFGFILLNMDLELLALDYYANDFWEFIYIYILSGNMYAERHFLHLDFVVFIFVPIALFLLSIRGFQLIEIRKD